MRANAQLGGRGERVALEYGVISPETLSIIYDMCTIWGRTTKTPGSELSGLPRPGSSEDTPCRLIRTPNGDPPSHDSLGRLHEDPPRVMHLLFPTQKWHGARSKAVRPQDGCPHDCTYGKDAANLGERELVLSSHYWNSLHRHLSFNGLGWLSIALQQNGAKNFNNGNNGGLDKVRITVKGYRSPGTVTSIMNMEHRENPPSPE